MSEIIWVFVGFVSLCSLLYSEYKSNIPMKALFKSLTAVSFLIYGYSQGLESDYSRIVFGGLILSFLGDIFLIPKSFNLFLLGLFSFMLAHLLYSYAFWGIAVFRTKEIAISIIPLVTGLLFYLWIRNRLGSFRLPVLFYLVAIHAMLVSAIGMHGDDYLGRETGYALLGALLFYLSDFAVARERFVRKSFWNKVWGLPFYFVGQFLIAYSMKFF